jgi:D-alanyl-D-alanine carboxypeptidase
MNIEPATDPSRTPPNPTRRLSRIAAALVVAAIAVPAASAQAADTPDPAGPRLQTILDRAVRAPGATFPGVALTVRRPGHATWSGAAGKASIDPARRMRPGDRFRAGSILKPFVAVAVLQLVEEGELALDARLPTVLPASVTARFPEADRITVRMLLNHTSGIGEYNDEGFHRDVLADPARRWKLGELLDRAAALPRTGAPGERFAYSNTNYNLLGRVLEQATGKPWRTVIRERVIDRLKLTHTSLPRPGTTPAGRDIARGYEPVDGRLVDVSDIDASMAGAAGGHALLTSAQDLSRFLRATLSGRLFQRRETAKAMRTFVTAQDPDGLDGYGLGLERYGFPGGLAVVGHMGTTGGYRVLMFHLPAQHIDLTMVINAPTDPTPVLFPAVELLLG